MKWNEQNLVVRDLEANVKDGILEVHKTERLDEHDIDSIVYLDQFDFHNGTIEVMMKSELEKDAPEYARGFIGIAFRIPDDVSAFESFYVRPTNSMTDDPVRKRRGGQYFTYPDYTFDYYRENGITDFEAEVPGIALGKWMKLKAKIHDDSASFYVDDMDHPVLEVSGLKLGADRRGSAGLFIDTGTAAEFRDLKVISPAGRNSGLPFRHLYDQFWKQERRDSSLVSPFLLSPFLMMKFIIQVSS